MNHFKNILLYSSICSLVLFTNCGEDSDDVVADADSDFIYLDEGEETDVWALKNNYVSVVPTQLDLTDYNALTTLKDGKGFI